VGIYGPCLRELGVTVSALLPCHPQDSKDGRLFNEQNFFQRVAKPLQGIPRGLGRGVGLGDRVLEVFYEVTKDLSVHLSCTHKPAPITLRGQTGGPGL
jgi:hypothetical protein